MPDLSVLAELRWRWTPWISYKWGAMFFEGPPRIEWLPRHWADHGRSEKRPVLAEEVGHYLAGATHGWRVAKEERRRCEGRAWRRGARWLIEDVQVAQAIADGCEFIEEFALRWEVPNLWAQKRLELYWSEHPPERQRRCA